VTLTDKREFKAHVIGSDKRSDVAILRIDGAGLPFVRIGDDGKLKVGEWVLAFGSPFNLDNTVTAGIVSAKQRDTGDYLKLIQTDVAINPGNSGGPLVNMNGEVVGINSAIYSPNTGSGRGQQGGSVGIGFAIPIDQARRTADEIVKTGKATQTVLGVTVQTPQAGGGAQVQTVGEGGAAAQAGIAVGDVITKMDDRRIDTSDALVAAVRSKAPGDKVTLTIGNGTRTVQVTLGGQPAPTN
jgi:putative serine protease PepD